MNKVAIVGANYGQSSLVESLQSQLRLRGVAFRHVQDSREVDPSEFVVHVMGSYRNIHETNCGDLANKLPFSGNDPVGWVKAVTDLITRPATALLIDQASFKTTFDNAEQKFGADSEYVSHARREMQTATLNVPFLLGDYLVDPLVTADAEALVETIASTVEFTTPQRRHAPQAEWGYSFCTLGAIGAVGQEWRQRFSGLVGDLSETGFNPLFPKGVPYNEKAKQYEQAGKRNSRFRVVYLGDRRGIQKPDFTNSGLSVLSLVEATTEMLLYPESALVVLGLDSYLTNLKKVKDQTDETSISRWEGVERELQAMREIAQIFVQLEGPETHSMLQPSLEKAAEVVTSLTNPDLIRSELRATPYWSSDRSTLHQ